MSLVKLNAVFFVVLVLGYTFAQQPEPLKLDLSTSDGSSIQVAGSLMQLLSWQLFYPGLSLTVSITPPPDASDAFLATVLDSAKFAVSVVGRNHPAEVSASATKNADGYLSNIQLQIHVATD